MTEENISQEFRLKKKYIYIYIKKPAIVSWKKYSKINWKVRMTKRFMWL